jgi:hypothetical protein
MKTELQPIEPRKILIPYSRVSSGPQATEDRTGIERQLQSARRCVATHPGWILDEHFNLTDPAKSGYKGANLEPDAALGGFLKMLNEGKIPLTPTKILHIDDMSRLSRLPIKKARQLFEGILESGVEIYVHQDNKLYTKESLDTSMDLIISLLRIEASHKLSSDLGDKVKAAWSIKKTRSAESGKPFRSKTYSWLKWNEATQSYDTIPEKVKSVERVFELAIQGIGVRGITKRLNAEGTPVIGTACGKKIKSTIWTTSSITKLLRRKGVLGYNINFEPPVKMYPAIISEKTFYKAQAKNEEHRTHKYYGRSSDKPQNLFVGLAKCSKCNAPMYTHRQKTPITSNTGSRGGKSDFFYLRCKGVINGVCSDSMFRYDKLEESFASMLSGSAFVNAYGETKPEQTNEVEVIQGKVTETHTRLERYTADYEKQPSNALLNLMAKTETEEKNLRQEMEQAKTAKVGTSPLQDTRNELLAILYKGWYDTEVRLKLRELIRAVVEKIIINGIERTYTVYWKNGDKPTTVQVFNRAYKIDGLLMMASPHWEQDIVKAGEVIRQLEGHPKAPATEPIADKVVKHLESGMLTKANNPPQVKPIDTAKEPVKPSRKRKGLKPLPDKEPV